MSNMPVTPRQQRAGAASSPRNAAHTAPMSERQQMALLLQMTSQDKPSTPPNNPGEERRRTRQQRNERGETPLHIAAKKGDQEQVQKLLEQGISPDVTDFAGWTPLHEACSYGWYEIVQTLVTAGANVNARGLDDDTPLHDAAGTGNLQMVKYLVENGADPCAKNNVGKMASDFSSQLIYDYLVSIKESAGTARPPHTAKKSNVGAGVADTKRDNMADTDKDSISGASEKPTESKDDSHSQVSSTTVSSTQEDASAAASTRPQFDSETTDASDDEASKRKKRKEEPAKEAAKQAQPSRGTAGRNVLPGTKPPGPASKTGATPLGKNNTGASTAKPGTGVTAGKSVPGPAGKSAAVAQAGKSAGASKSTGPSAAPCKGPERKSPEDTPKTNPTKELMEVDGEETKTQESSGPKVPPLKIVIPGGVGGGGGGSGGPQEGDSSASGRGGSGKGRGSVNTLPYVIPCTNSEGGSTSAAVSTDGNDSDDKKNGDEKRVLRSHRTTDEKDKDGRLSPLSAGGSTAFPPSTTIPTTTTETQAVRTTTVTQEESTTTTSTAAATTTTTSSSSSSWSGSGSSNELHPRKRKIRASKESHQRETKEQPPEAARDATEAPSLPANHSNPAQQYIDIRRQIERRQKALFPVQPKPPQGFKDYLMNRGTYLLQKNIKPMAPVNPPASLPPQMRDQYVKHEKERHNLKIQHIIEKEKLVLSVEQEILRVHGRAARALANQALPFSACTILRDAEVYNAITPEQEEKERNAQRSRYNGRLFLSWLQDVDDKWEKIKEGMVRRHHTEAETLHAVQKMQWEWKLKEFGLCDYKTTPKIEPAHVPQVHVSDDFDLLPA